MSSSSYILDPGAQDLSAHSGQRVEVTGTLAPANSMSGSGSTSSPGATPSTGAAPATGNPSGGTASSGSTATGSIAAAAGGGQRIQVTSVKMIAQSCQ